MQCRKTKVKTQVHRSPPPFLPQTWASPVGRGMQMQVVKSVAKKFSSGWPMSWLCLRLRGPPECGASSTGSPRTKWLPHMTHHTVPTQCPHTAVGTWRRKHPADILREGKALSKDIHTPEWEFSQQKNYKENSLCKVTEVRKHLKTLRKCCLERLRLRIRGPGSRAGDETVGVSAGALETPLFKARSGVCECSAAIRSVGSQWHSCAIRCSWNGGEGREGPGVGARQNSCWGDRKRAVVQGCFKETLSGTGGPIRTFSRSPQDPWL